MEYSVRLSGEALLDNIQTAYDRADRNAVQAIELAHNSEWLWGPYASFDTYSAEDSLHHQLTGEIQYFGKNYRSEAYWMCADPIAKELVEDFPSFVMYATRRYVEEAQAPNASLAERAIALDHAKQYALTMFHAVQYPARSRVLEADELEQVGQYAAIAEDLTTAFYGTILGQEPSVINKNITQAEGLLHDPALEAAIQNIPVKQFKQQELDQPLTILMSSLLAVDKYPDTDIIYALPAGGTQHAMVTRMLYSLKNPGQPVPALAYLPISTHSVKKESLQAEISPGVEQAIRLTNPNDRNVLICEDNSNSGTTVSMATDMIAASLPASCAVSLVEFDPRRLEVKNRNLSPAGHVANFHHPDFDTAVGIVPVTVGKYPDAQLRKVMPLRAQRHRAHEQLQSVVDTRLEYDAIPGDFFADFEKTYQDTLRYCGDLHGYRNPYQVAAAMVRQYSEQGVLQNLTIREKYDTAQQMARAAIEYPYLPDSVKARLEAGEETMDYTIDGPWIRSGAIDFIKELRKYAQDTDSHVLIWTKGDGSFYSNPPYVGAEEQQLRFTISGLETKFNELGFFDQGHGSFLAHPKKVPLLGTRFLPNLKRHLPHVSDIVIVDDSEKNLAEAAQEIRRFDYVPHPINPLIHNTERTRLDYLTALARQKQWGEHVAFVIDMDDTLLHEQFRKYHQPRNMALALLQAAPKR